MTNKERDCDGCKHKDSMRNHETGEKNEYCEHPSQVHELNNITHNHKTPDWCPGFSPDENNNPQEKPPTRIQVREGVLAKIKICYMTHKGAGVVKFTDSYKKMGRIIKGLWQARIEAVATDQDGYSVGAVWELDNKLVWFYDNGEN